jgi:replicative superfamily II helicase
MLLYYLTQLSGDNYILRETKVPSMLRVALVNYTRELQRANACLRFIATHNEEFQLPSRLLEDTVLKIIYGVPDEVLELVKIKGVGRVLAIKLFENDIRCTEDVVAFSDQVIKLLGPKRGTNVVYQAEKMQPVPF